MSTQAKTFTDEYWSTYVHMISTVLPTKTDMNFQSPEDILRLGMLGMYVSLLLICSIFEVSSFTNSRDFRQGPDLNLWLMRYNRENQYLSLMRTMYTLVPQIMPLLTLMWVRMWYEESTPRVISQLLRKEKQRPTFSYLRLADKGHFTHEIESPWPLHFKRSH
jgi:hypothetical protein